MTKEVEDLGVDRGEGLAVSLGASLRKLRKARGLTLQQLADACGLSQPFLSQLENRKAMPSLVALHNIAQALGTTAHAMIGQRPEMDICLVRGATAQAYELDEGATVRFLVDGSSHFMEPNLIQSQPGYRSSHMAHSGEEMIYVLDGRLGVDLEDSGRFELNSGDALIFPATVPHSLETVGETVCSFLIISSPPSF